MPGEIHVSSLDELSWRLRQRSIASVVKNKTE